MQLSSAFLLPRVNRLRRFVSVANRLSTVVEATAAQPHNLFYKDPVTYPNFKFDVHQTSTTSKARVATITTPHGTVETPNFIFCATKAAMKSITTQQLKDEGAQIMLSNTYHLMLTPGADLVEAMGGLHQMTGWKGPMLTDSGGYQIFSMGHGSVSNEIKGKRGTNNTNTFNQTLLGIDEEGATFRSYVDGVIHRLTPESSIEIQRKLGADLIVVFDECTPFNVDKSYTADSMRRSHRWGIRSLQEFSRSASGKQALYGIVQGGVYEDLRQESCSFVNDNPFFGIAIGGSLGATKQDMHSIVAYTRGLLRNDRPVHLLGIGGVRDIFHGVRQGIDTFDCVHPTRLGRHGGALVTAAHWEEESGGTEGKVSEVFTLAITQKANKLKDRELNRQRSLARNLRILQTQRGFEKIPVEDLETRIAAVELGIRSSEEKVRAIEEGRLEGIVGSRHLPLSRHAASRQRRVVREHIHLTKSNMRHDHRPIDATCDCYTCKTFTRSYLHHLFKAQETLGCTLVTIHNAHFMNRMMKDIREGIRSNTLDAVEQKYVHPDLAHSLEHGEGITSIGM